MQIAVGETITATSFLSIAITLFTLGVQFFEQSNMSAGVVCFLTGVALIFLAIALVQLGIVRVSRRAESGSRQSPQAR